MKVKGDGDKILTRIFSQKENGALADKAIGERKEPQLRTDKKKARRI